MKRILTLLAIAILFASGTTFAQKLPLDSTKKVIYTEVVQMPGMSKDKLFERAMKAINAMYKLADKKIDKKDPEGGLLMMNCSTQVVLKDPSSHLDVQSGYIKYKFNMYFKEGKYKYEFKTFHVDKGGFPDPVEKLLPENSPEPRLRAPERIKILDDDIKRLIVILKDNMSKDQVDVKKDW